MIPAGIYRRNWSASLSYCIVHTGDLTYLGSDVVASGCTLWGPSVATALGCICLCVCVYPHTHTWREPSRRPSCVLLNPVHEASRAPLASVSSRAAEGLINALDVCGPRWFAAGVAFLFGVCCTAHRSRDCSSLATLDEATG